MSGEGFYGHSGKRISHFDRGDNGWGFSINKSLETIAKSIDQFNYGIEDVDREVDAAISKRFQDLKISIGEFVTEYTNSMDDQEEISVEKLQAYIDLRLGPVIEEFISSSQRDLAVTKLMKDMLQNQLGYIDSSIVELKSDFDRNIQLISDQMVEARESRDSVSAVINAKTLKAEELLDDHIADKDNPHNTEIEDIPSQATVYQYDPDNSNVLIEPSETYNPPPDSDGQQQPSSSSSLSSSS